jgi:exopolysaccharide biosynthesis protein
MPRMATHDSNAAHGASAAVFMPRGFSASIPLPLFLCPTWCRLRATLSALFVGFAILLTDGLSLQAASTSSARPSDSDLGVVHSNDRIPQGPWSIHVAKIDRSRKDLAFYAPLAMGKVLGVSKISDQAVAVPREVGRAIAGVNGDFYERDNRTYAGDPRGLQIVNGELVSGTSTACVWFDAEGNPHVDDVAGDFKITWPNGRQTPFGLNEQRRSGTAVLYTPTYGPSTRVAGGRDIVLEREGNSPWLPLQAGQNYRAKVREVQSSTNTPLPASALVLSLGPSLIAKVPEVAAGAVLQISTATTHDLKGVKTAIAGGPALVKNGKAFSEKAPPPGAAGAYSERSKYERHPRSAIGWNATHIYLLTVDGRQPGLSVGMTLAELADYMVKLGCTDGMNFDGGNSATMWMSGKVVNSPCVGERPVANSLFVIRKPLPGS